MPDVIVNVAPQPTVSVEVDIDNVASYYYELAKQWAISPDLVEQLDYSSKYYANKSHEYADSILTDTGFIDVVQSLNNINTVAEDLDNINAVVLNKTNIDKVADNETNINAAVVNEANINAAVANETNINAAVANETNINLVANDKTNIDIVAAAKTNIDTNATYINNINTTAQYISNINICAANIPVITDKVSKTGDTMTGNLTINKVAPTISCKAVGLNKTSTTAPSSDIVGALLQTQDENGNYVSTFYTSHNTSNNFATGINQERTINGVNKQSFFDINIAADGTDFVSASAGAKQSITNWAFPSSRYDNVTLGASGTQYTAPADGYVYLWGVQYDYNGGLFLTNNANGLQVISQPPNANSFEVRVWIPITKGDSYTVAYSALYIHGFRFIYANGEA